MEELEIDDCVLENKELRDEVKSFSFTLYLEFWWRPKLDSLDFMSLDERNYDYLQQGILEGLMHYRWDKTPAPDGFQHGFSSEALACVRG